MGKEYQSPKQVIQSYLEDAFISNTDEPPVERFVIRHLTITSCIVNGAISADAV